MDFNSINNTLAILNCFYPLSTYCTILPWHCVYNNQILLPQLPKIYLYSTNPLLASTASHKNVFNMQFIFFIKTDQFWLTIFKAALETFCKIFRTVPNHIKGQAHETFCTAFHAILFLSIEYSWKVVTTYEVRERLLSHLTFACFFPLTKHIIELTWLAKMF